MKLFIALLTIIAIAESRRCEPKSIFFEYCNTCWCSADGESAECTKVVCSSGQWNKDGSLKPLFPEKSEQICEPGTTFYDYCNTCRCSIDGKRKSCTLMFCDHRLWNKDGTLKMRNNEPTEPKNSDVYCEPNARFEQYCDQCECSSDGKSAVCTYIDGCDSNIWNEDGNLKFGLRPGQVCRPGSKYDDRCNACTCADNGINAVCTRMGCSDSWTRYGRFPVHLKNP